MDAVIRRPEEKKRAVLCGISTGNKNEYSSEETMEELRELANTAGAEVFATVLQNKAEPEAATMLGAGKLGEVAEICRNNHIELLIFDDELSGTQIKNIEDITGARAIDRTALILDIFAKRAKSREGSLQVELAQLQYLMPRLSGMRPDLSRLGGGIGTRGPGEKKLETDRRHIRRRILYLERGIGEIARRRDLIRTRRTKNGIRTAAIVGYTNAGKSTLLNRLTDAGVLTENALFATLDPTARALRLPDGKSVLLIDTVGFIRKLPHHLVDAFRSTLEEASHADLILNVCDISNPEVGIQTEVSESILRELGCSEKPQLLVLNKCDRANAGFVPLSGRESVRISARTGEGMDALLYKIGAMLPAARARIKLLVPYPEGGITGLVRQYGAITSEEYCPEGIEISGEIDEDKKHLVSRYLI